MRALPRAFADERVVVADQVQSDPHEDHSDCAPADPDDEVRRAIAAESTKRADPQTAKTGISSNAYAVTSASSST